MIIASDNKLMAPIIDIEKSLSKEFAFLSAKIAPVQEGNRLFGLFSLTVFD
jgi:hypothetical protein